jgi:hypothetical protein
MKSSWSEKSHVGTALLDDLAPHHVSIAVTDMDRAIEWYASVLGFETEFRFHVAAIPAEGAFLKGPELRLELWCAAGAAPIQRDPKEPMVVDSDPLARDQPPVFALSIRDPFGTLIELLDRERLHQGNS